MILESPLSLPSVFLPQGGGDTPFPLYSLEIHFPWLLSHLRFLIAPVKHLPLPFVEEFGGPTLDLTFTPKRHSKDAGRTNTVPTLTGDQAELTQLPCKLLRCFLLGCWENCLPGVPPGPCCPTELSGMMEML